MKVKGIAFMGAMAAILASSGVASAATPTKIASQAYVDNRVGKLGETGLTGIDDQSSVSQAIKAAADLAQSAAGALDGVDLSALATKQEAQGYATTAETNAKTHTDNLVGTLGAAGELAGTSMEAATTIVGALKTLSGDVTAVDTKVGELSTLTNVNITDTSSVTAAINSLAENMLTDGNLSDINTAIEDLDDTVNGTGVDGDTGLVGDVADNTTNITNITNIVSGADGNGGLVADVNELKNGDWATKEYANTVANTAETNAKTAMTNKVGDLSQTGLDGITNDSTVTDAVKAVFDATIPAPTGACAAESGRCVLSTLITQENGQTVTKMEWVDVTAPLE